MPDNTEAAGNTPGRRRYAWAIWTVAGLALAAIIADHWIHVLGWLPYALLLACPLMHVFMHRGHGHQSHANHRPPGSAGP